MEEKRINSNLNFEKAENSIPKINDSFFYNEDLNNIFEKDSRRYKRYLGDDILKEQLL